MIETSRRKENVCWACNYSLRHSLWCPSPEESIVLMILPIFNIIKVTKIRPASSHTWQLIYSWKHHLCFNHNSIWPLSLYCFELWFTLWLALISVIQIEKCWKTILVLSISNLLMYLLFTHPPPPSKCEWKIPLNWIEYQILTNLIFLFWMFGL